MVRVWQKESLGEYGSGWEWDYEYTHAFDQAGQNDIPFRFDNESGLTSSSMNFYECISDIEYTSSSNMYDNIPTTNVSCNPNAGNAGNLYTWIGAIIDDVPLDKKIDSNNSICAKGWMLPKNAEENKKSFYNLIKVHYNITDNNDKKIIIIPFSFTRTGSYIDGSTANRMENGHYWSSTMSSKIAGYYLSIKSSYLSTHDAFVGSTNGFSVRCVSR